MNIILKLENLSLRSSLDPSEINIARSIDLEIDLTVHSDNATNLPLEYDWENSYHIVNELINNQSYKSVEAFLGTLYLRLLQEDKIKNVKIKLLRTQSNIPAYYRERCPNLHSIIFSYP